MTDRTAYFEMIEQLALSGQMSEGQLQEYLADDPELKAWFEARAKQRQNDAKHQPLSEIIRERNILAVRVKSQRNDILTLIQRNAELAAELRALKGAPETPTPDPVFAAIGVMQRHGIR